MKCPSSGSIRHRFLYRHRPSGDCPQPPEPLEVARFHRNPAPCALLVSVRRRPRAQPSPPGLCPSSRQPPTSALLPHGQRPAPPQLRPSEVCQRGPPPLGGWRRAAVHVEKLQDRCRGDAKRPKTHQPRDHQERGPKLLTQGILVPAPRSLCPDEPRELAQRLQAQVHGAKAFGGLALVGCREDHRQGELVRSPWSTNSATPSACLGPFSPRYRVYSIRFCGWTVP